MARVLSCGAIEEASIAMAESSKAREGRSGKGAQAIEEINKAMKADSLEEDRQDQ